MNPADNRVRITKMMIRNALLQLLKEKTLQTITVRELCQVADINRGTFYTHYRDLYDLMEQIENELTEEFQQMMKPLLHENASVSLIDMITGIFSLIQTNADLCLITLGPNGDKNFLYRLVAIGKQACIASYLSSDTNLDPEAVDYFYTFISAGCIAILEQWLKEGMQMPVAELARMVKGFIANGASSPNLEREASCL